MRILMIHANSFEFSVTDKTAISKIIRPMDEAEKSGSLGDSLVCFTAVEKGDLSRTGEIVEKALALIAKHFEQVKAKSLMLYPYAHLSADLAPPRDAQAIMDQLIEKAPGFVKGVEIKHAPFGYYKSFKIDCKGHPLSENGITVNLETGKDGKKPGAPESAALQADSQRLSKLFFAVPKDGQVSLVEGENFKFGNLENLQAFYAYEKSGTRVSDQPPPHIALMEQHELVGYEPGSDAGNFRWYPKGYLIKKLMEDRVSSLMNQYGAMRVETPIMYDYLHPHLSKYLERFPARQYILKSEDKEFFLRFAACFGQYLIMHDAQMSYKQLPLQLYELTHYSFRREKTGELSGLRRLRTFTMPDMHTLCADIPQAKEEFLRQFNLSLQWMQDMQFEFEVAIRVVKDFYDENKEFVHDLVRRMNRPCVIEVWDRRFFYFVLKFEFNFVDNLGKASALSTVQIDVENCCRFEIKYMDQDGQKKEPVILHASISGSIDRNLYALLESQARAMKRSKKAMYPFWLAPTQIRFVPINEKCVAFCEEAIKQIPFRADLDDQDQSMQKKIRNAETEWVPMIAVVGEREMADNKIALRIRGEEGQKVLTVPETIDLMRNLQGEKPMLPLNLKPRLSARPIFMG